jgi:DNA-binding GntR family transcriptional regulator
MAVISRQPLRSQIRSHLVERLLGGDLEPGSQLNENQLTEELGVSRTPLREALLQLEFEGLLRSTPGKGFSVAPLEEEEMMSLFEVGGELESLALRLGGGVSEGQLEELRDINTRRREILLENGDRDDLVSLDDRWHRILVSNCNNDQLLELLRLIRNRLYRYVYAFEGQKEKVEEAILDHEEIADALASGDLDGAIGRLHDHWQSGRRTMQSLMSDVT